MSNISYSLENKLIDFIDCHFELITINIDSYTTNHSFDASNFATHMRSSKINRLSIMTTVNMNEYRFDAASDQISCFANWTGLDADDFVGTVLLMLCLDRFVQGH